MPQSVSGTFRDTQKSRAPDATNQMSERGPSRDAAGFFEGRHYVDWSQDVRRLEWAGDMGNSRDLTATELMRPKPKPRPLVGVSLLLRMSVSR